MRGVGLGMMRHRVKSGPAKGGEGGGGRGMHHAGYSEGLGAAGVGVGVVQAVEVERDECRQGGGAAIDVGDDLEPPHSRS